MKKIKVLAFNEACGGWKAIGIGFACDANFYCELGFVCQHIF